MPHTTPPFDVPKDDHDELVFADERSHALPGGASASAGAGPAWRVMIVDDDEDVHTTTEFALRNLDVGERELAFIHAYSSEQARALIEADPDVAVILLDVVMEHEDAGLQLVRHIRETLGRSDVRIILRTGQPGYAPEIEAIRDFDINDYRTKSELTRTRLYTAVTSAIRSYQQIRAVNAGQRGMDQVAHAMLALIALDGFDRFAAGILEQSAAILGIAPAGLLSIEEPRGALSEELALHVDSGAAQARAHETMLRALQQRRNVYGDDSAALYCAGKSSRACVAWLDTGRPLSALEQRLLDVFGASVGVGLDNLQLVSRLRDAAFYDQLSKLPNRTRLIDVIDTTLAGPERDQAVLCLVDLDHFAETNDALGHQFGDQLLVAVAARLQGQLQGMGEASAVARVGGDLFAVLGPASVVHPAGLLAMFEAPFSIDGQDVQVTATLGLLRLAEHDGSGADALKDADIALKRAKAQQRAGHFYFSRSMGVEIRERVRTMHALRNGFARGDLFLVYQPQVDLSSGRAVGAEALLRWQTPDGTFISPDRFIPIAEYSGLIIDIGEWVLRSACHELVRLRAAGHHDFTMSVNVSQVQFRHPYFLDMLRAALADTKAPPECVELEITESMAMEEPDLLVRMLAQVKHLGVSIAIDDFGTGFSSLSYLQRLQVDRLKIDRAFVREITGSSRGSSIAEMVIQLGRNLGLTVIAEGVEDERQAEILQQLGCPLAQGFLYSRPMGTTALHDWLIDQQLRQALADGPRLASN